MKEIFFIIFQFFIFILFFSAPFSLYFNKIKQSNISSNIFYSISLNFIFLSNVLLFFSFFKFNYHYIFFFQLFLSFLLICYLIYKRNFINIFYQNAKIYLFYFFINLTLFFLLANYLRLEWDGLAFWFYKTSAFYQGISFENLKDLVYKNYPHLGSYIWAFFWKNSYLQIEYFGRLFYIFVYILSVFSVTDLFNKSYKSNFKIVFCSLVILFTYDHMLFGGYQEYLIFSILLFASRFIYEYSFLNRNRSTDLIIILFTINLLIWVKQEGIFYFSFIIILLSFNIVNNYLKKYFVILFSILAISISILLFNKLIGSFGFQSKLLHNQFIIDFNFFTILRKIYWTVYYIFVTFLKYPIWIIIFLSLTFTIFDKNSSKIKYFYIFLSLNVIFIFAVFIHTPYNLREMLSNALDRLMLQTSGFYIPLFIFLLNKYEKNFRKLNNFLK
jgi:hypothetical protein